MGLGVWRLHVRVVGCVHWCLLLGLLCPCGLLRPCGFYCFAQLVDAVPEQLQLQLELLVASWLPE